MTALPMVCIAYAFVSLGFCLGYVACAVLSRNTTPDAAPVGVTDFREGATRSNVKPTFPKPPPPAPPPARDVRGWP